MTAWQPGRAPRKKKTRLMFYCPAGEVRSPHVLLPDDKGRNRLVISAEALVLFIRYCSGDRQPIQRKALRRQKLLLHQKLAVLAQQGLDVRRHQPLLLRDAVTAHKGQGLVFGPVGAGDEADQAADAVLGIF